MKKMFILITFLLLMILMVKSQDDNNISCPKDDEIKYTKIQNK